MDYRGKRIAFFIKDNNQLRLAKKLLIDNDQVLSKKDTAFELIYDDMRYPYLKKNEINGEWYLSNRISWHEATIFDMGLFEKILINKK